VTWAGGHRLAAALAFALLAWAWASPVPAQEPPGGAAGPAAPYLHRTSRLGRVWALYGAPQAGRLDRAAFDKLAGEVEATKFSTDNVQVVVIVRGAEADGTIGLLEKRGRKFTRLFVEPGGAGIFDVWRRVGHRLTLERILADYRDNVLAADDLYLQLPIQFTGQVKRVSRDEGGATSVEFSIRRSDRIMACTPMPGALQLVDPRDIRAGQRLDVAGQFVEYNQDGLRARDCLFSPAK